MELLRSLLEPLRTPSTPPTWLTKSPRFLNRLLEAYAEFFVRDVFEVPAGAIFVSKKTTESKDPFVKWASSYLTQRGAPVSLPSLATAAATTWIVVG